MSKININENMNVLDVGCGKDGRSVSDYAPLDWSITGIDILAPAKVHHKHPKFRYVMCDASNLSQFDSDSFDVCICVGMFEHIVHVETYMAIASEIQRVGRQYIIIAPYKYCLIEPHYGIPFFPLLPYGLKLSIIKAINLSDQRHVIAANSNYVKDNYIWHSNSEYLSIFPSSHVYILPTLDTIAVIKRN
jgi:SAM-dependent methyltransferase